MCNAASRLTSPLHLQLVFPFFRLEARGWRIVGSPQLLAEVDEKLRTKDMSLRS